MNLPIDQNDSHIESGQSNPFTPPLETFDAPLERRSWFAFVALIVAVTFCGAFLLMTIQGGYRNLNVISETGFRRIRAYSLVLPVVTFLCCTLMTIAALAFRRGSLPRGIAWFVSAFVVFYGLHEVLWALLV